MIYLLFLLYLNQSEEWDYLKKTHTF